MSSSLKSILLAALLTALVLVGGLTFGMLVGVLLNQSLPMHIPEATRNLFSALPVLLILACTGAGWGYVLGLISNSAYRRRMAWAGGMSFGPGIILVALSLTYIEVQIVELGRGPEIAVHILYTLLFVPAAFVVAALGGLSLGVASKNSALMIKSSLRVGLAAALAFLIINLTMDALGWRVGAPGAASRATMLTVTFVGCLGAALSAGAVIGYFLKKEESILPAEFG